MNNSVSTILAVFIDQLKTNQLMVIQERAFRLYGYEGIGSKVKCPPTTPFFSCLYVQTCFFAISH